MKHSPVFPKQATMINQNFYNDDRVDGWNPGEQHTVFLELLKISDFSKKSFEDSSVLDVGCGTGKLLDILSRNGISKYFGIDILESAVKTAKDNHKTISSVDVKFLVQDPLTWEYEEPFDFVFASGALSINLEPFGIDNYDFVKQMIEKMMSLTRYGLVCNFITDTQSNPGSALFFYNPKKVLNICQNIAPKGSIHQSFTEVGETNMTHLYLTR